MIKTKFIENTLFKRSVVGSDSRYSERIFTEIDVERKRVRVGVERITRIYHEIEDLEKVKGECMRNGGETDLLNREFIKD
jgi:hypothetical protein